MAYTTVPTITTGDIATAAWGNTYIRDNFRHLRGEDGPITMEDALLLPSGAGFYFRLPVLTTTQRDALSPADGWTIYNSTKDVVEVYDGAAWREMPSPAVDGVQGDVVFRGASNWERLAAGTVNQVLTTGGAGADPSWTDTPNAPLLVADDDSQIAATGTATSPGNANDDNTGNIATFDAIDETVIITFRQVFRLTQYRIYGSGSQAGDGTYKIQYWDRTTEAWVDWVTGIATRGASWSSWDNSGGEITTNRIQIVATALDTTPAPDDNRLAEIELKY